MTSEEAFYDLFDKYGEAFNWMMIPFTKATGALVAELKKEIGSEHFLYGKTIYAVAKCESDDDVLYVTDNEFGKDIYYIFHLTYSEQNINEFPKYKEFKDIYAVKEYLEQSFIENYM